MGVFCPQILYVDTHTAGEENAPIVLQVPGGKGDILKGGELGKHACPDVATLTGFEENVYILLEDKGDRFPV